MVESLLIDIETILKLVRFIPTFRSCFIKNKYLDSNYLKELDKYVENANVLSKDTLWGFCCVLEHIIEINILIKEWRSNTPDFTIVEKDIFKTQEKIYSHDIIGQIIKTNNNSENYTKLTKELKENRFLYNGVSIMPSSTINKSEACLLHFFY